MNEDCTQEMDAQDRYDDLVAQFERDGMSRENAIRMADAEWNGTAAVLTDGTVIRA